MTRTRHERADIAVLGAGSAASALVRALDGDPTVVVFEPGLVGGACPYDACIPSKSLLHDGAIGRAWSTASDRRRELIHHRDDTSHAAAIERTGARLVRERASFVDAHHVTSPSVAVEADHVVIATGSTPRLPPIDGLDDVRDRWWTSDQALRTAALPDRLIVLGCGVVGAELTRLFRAFGVDVVVLEPEERLFGTLHPEVSAAIETTVRATGAELVLGRRPVAVRRHGDGIAVIDDRGVERHADRALVATGRRPALDGLGLEHLGLVIDDPLPVDANGRVRSPGSIWAIGDAAGREQYTHAANHHGRVVADHLTGRGERHFDDVVSAACMFTDPPMLQVGPSFAETRDRAEVTWVAVDLGESSARAATDELAGVLAVAVDRGSRCVIAAHGIGAGFDELVHAIVIAVDGGVPVDRLVRSMVPFPTLGDVWHAAVARLHAELDR
jgi:pyruvate/2-oxoglutarate dehydrogenase complex dihydrolipoamide dehydrogenase (E3) component